MLRNQMMMEYHGLAPDATRRHGHTTNGGVMAGLRLGEWGGWAYYDSGEPENEVILRFDDDGQGRLVIMKLHVTRVGGLNGSDLRRLPVGKIEALANAPRVAQEIRERLAKPAPKDVYLDEDFWGQRVVVAPVSVESLPSEIKARPFDELTPQEQRLALAPRLNLTEMPAAMMDDTIDLLLAEVPEGNRKPDEFYRQVAAVYGSLSGASGSPAVKIAERKGLPVSTVHRWVKEARRRGFLPPGRRPGSVSREDNG